MLVRGVIGRESLERFVARQSLAENNWWRVIARETLVYRVILVRVIFDKAIHRELSLDRAIDCNQLQL